MVLRVVMVLIESKIAREILKQALIVVIKRSIWTRSSTEGFVLSVSLFYAWSRNLGLMITLYYLVNIIQDWNSRLIYGRIMTHDVWNKCAIRAKRWMLTYFLVARFSFLSMCTPCKSHVVRLSPLQIARLLGFSDPIHSWPCLGPENPVKAILGPITAFAINNRTIPAALWYYSSHII